MSSVVECAGRTVPRNRGDAWIQQTVLTNTQHKHTNTNTNINKNTNKNKNTQHKPKHTFAQKQKTTLEVVYGNLVENRVSELNNMLNSIKQQEPVEAETTNN